MYIMSLAMLIYRSLCQQRLQSQSQRQRNPLTTIIHALHNRNQPYGRRRSQKANDPEISNDSPRDTCTLTPSKRSRPEIIHQLLKHHAKRLYSEEMQRATLLDRNRETKIHAQVHKPGESKDQHEAQYVCQSRGAGDAQHGRKDKVDVGEKTCAEHLVPC